MLVLQEELGRQAAERLTSERNRADSFMQQLLEQQDGVKKLLASHKETQGALSKSTALNKVCGCTYEQEATSLFVLTLRTNSDKWSQLHGSL
jgi:hypothetical protein